ncbi:MAG: hypothetical protein HIU89_16750 [Proteobacteria bacterium]|nr:hypothetical protein [Pseudomonadota bacterium]
MIPVAPDEPSDGEPVYLGSEERPWFAWLHRTAAPIDTGVGLVIVPPFGFEAVCAHRALRHLAIDAAAAGVAAARIDLDGTGDSAGCDLDPQRIERWIASIDAAADALRANGASRLVFAGVRLGALLAVLCAAGRRDVAGVAAIAPVVSGRRWMREMRALQLALALPPAASGRIVDGDVQEVLGFPLTAATREVLAQIDLENMAQSPAPAVLVLDRQDLAVGAKWAAHLRELGADVEYCRLPGYAEMVLDPHRTEIPVEIIAATIAFAGARPALDAVPSAPALAKFSHAQLGDVFEHAVVMQGGIRAMVTRPLEGRPRSALVLLNAGCVRRIGPNRLHVPMARRLAAELGMMVVRADLSGIGDSPPHAGLVENLVYHEHALNDIQAMIQWCNGEGADEVHLAGLCSGGYYAWRAAHAGQGLRGVVVINPGAPGVPDTTSPYQAAAETARYQEMLRSSRGWKQLRSKVRDADALRRLTVTFSVRARNSLQALAKRWLRRVGVVFRDDPGISLLQLTERGIAVTFLFCASEPGLVLLRERAGDVLARLQRSGALSLRILDGIDHTFTPLWSHPILEEELLDALRRART